MAKGPRHWLCRSGRLRGARAGGRRRQSTRSRAEHDDEPQLYAGDARRYPYDLGTGLEWSWRLRLQQPRHCVHGRLGAVDAAASLGTATISASAAAAHTTAASRTTTALAASAIPATTSVATAARAAAAFATAAIAAAIAAALPTAAAAASPSIPPSAPPSPTPAPPPSPPPFPPPRIPPSPPLPPTPPPPENLPTDPLNLRRGPGITGFELTKAIHVVWDEPASDGGLPVTEYKLRATNTATGAADPVVTLTTGSGGFAGPAAGYFLASVGGQSLLPGQSVSFELAACNGLARMMGGGGQGCGNFAPNPSLTLATSNSTPGKVPVPVVSNVNATTLVLDVGVASYTGGAPITRYDLRVFTLPASSSDRIINLGSSAPVLFAFEGRQSDLNYAFEARAVNEEGVGAWSDTLWVQSGAAEMPNTPQNLNAGSLTPTSFDLSWIMPNDNRSSGIFQYVVQLQSSGGAVVESIVLGGLGNCTSGCSSTVSGSAVRPATTYTSVAVAAQNSFAQSLFSTSISVTTLSSEPGEVGAPYISTVGTDFIAVNWTAAVDNGAAISSYRVYLCDVPYGDALAEVCTAIDATGSPMPTNLLAGGLPPGRNFTVSVQAVNSLGSSANVSVPGLFTTLDVPMRCDPPTRRTPPLEGLPMTTTLHIVWLAPYNNGRPITTYNLTIVDGDTGIMEFVIVPHVEGTAIYEYTKTGLFPGSTHTFAVSAANELGSGLFSVDAPLATQTDVPGTPPMPYIILESASTIMVGLHPSPYDGGYPISNYQLEVNGILYPLEGNPLVLNYTVARNPFLSYQIRARARNSRGEHSDYSDYLLIAAIAALYPNAPTNLAHSTVTARSFLLTWSMPNDPLSNGILNYVLEMGGQLVQLPRTDCIGGCNYTIDDSLVDIRPATSYAVSLRSTNSLGQSVPTELTGNVTTLADVPEPVGSPQVYGIDRTALSVNWTAPHGNGAPVLSYDAIACDVQSGVCVILPVSNPSVGFADLTGLPEGRNWTVAVRALNSIGYSANATAPGIYTTHAVPLACEEPYRGPNLAGLNQRTAVFIEWTPPFDNGLAISDYELTVDGAAQTLGGATTQYLHMGLIPGTEHTFLVRARNSLGYGAASTVATERTSDGLPATPPPPEPDYSTDVDSGSRLINVQLQPSAYSGVFGQATPDFYQLEMQQSASSSGFSSSYFNVSSSVMVHEQPRLNTQNYRFRSRAWTYVGYGGWSGFVVVPNDFSGVPTEPSNVTVPPHALTADSLLVLWQIPAISKNRNVTFQIRLTPNTTAPVGSGRRLEEATPLDLPEQTPLYLPGRRLQAMGVGVIQAFAPFGACVEVGVMYQCSWVVGGVQPNTEYIAQVLAENSIGTSLPSEPTPPIITPAGRPDALVNLTVSYATRDSLTFEWTVPVSNGRDIAGYLFDLGDGNGVQGRSATGALVGAASDCAALLSAAGERTFAANGQHRALHCEWPAERHELQRERYRVQRDWHVVLSRVRVRTAACSPSCYSYSADENQVAMLYAGRPAHTKAVPDVPLPPTQDADPSLEPLKSRTLFVTWTDPFSHYLPVLETELTIANLGDSTTTYNLPAGTVSYNLGGRTPATQYAASLRMRNEEGWGDSSLTIWLSTIPDVPDAPPRPLCDPERSTDTMVYVRIQEANDNGLRIDSYQVHVTKPDGEGGTLLVANVTTGVEPLVLEALSGAAFNYSGTEFTAETTYNMIVRAHNGLGWGPYSVIDDGSCRTVAPYVRPFPWLLLVIPLVVFILLLLLCMLVWKLTDLPKILAPRLRAVEEKEDPLDDFIVKEDTPMEDFDPELQLNPVILAKLEVERNKAHAARRKGKGHKGTGADGVPGALARLNFRLSLKEKKVEEPKKANMKNIDFMLQRTNKKKAEAAGMPSSAAAAKEITKRALTMHSAAKAKKNKGKIENRMIHEANAASCAANKRACARAAAKLPAPRADGGGGLGDLVHGASVMTVRVVVW